MTQELFTVDAAAEALKLHPKTVLRFIREKKLKATKVGRAFRIARKDLDAFAGIASFADESGNEARATAILEVEDLTLDEAQRIITLAQASIAGPKDRPIQLETAYDRVRSGLKIIIIGSPGDVGALVSLLSNVIET